MYLSHSRTQNKKCAAFYTYCFNHEGVFIYEYRLRCVTMSYRVFISLLETYINFDSISECLRQYWISVSCTETPKIERINCKQFKEIDSKLIISFRNNVINATENGWIVSEMHEDALRKRCPLKAGQYQRSAIN